MFSKPTISYFSVNHFYFCENLCPKQFVVIPDRSSMCSEGSQVDKGLGIVVECEEAVSC